MGLAPGKHLTTNNFGHAMQYKLGNCANKLVFDVSQVEWYAVYASAHLLVLVAYFLNESINELHIVAIFLIWDNSHRGMLEKGCKVLLK